MSSEFISQIANQTVLLDQDSMPRAQASLAALASSSDLAKAHTEASASDDFWPSPGTFLSRLRPYHVKGGILEIPVKGVLLNDFPYAFFNLATGYDYIKKAVQRGVDDSDVRGIAFVIDSPGGAVAGNFDLVDMIYEARGSKPIKAFASELAASAAYSIASAAEDITVARTGSVGSIGVVTTHMDLSKMLEEDGLKITYIYAGKHKVDGNPTEPLSPDVKSRIQDRVNGLYDIFVSTVARNRGMEEEEVRATEALTFPAPEALSNKLADNIGSLDDGLAEFSATLTQNEGETTMSDKKESATVDQAQIDAAHEKGLSEGAEKGKAEGAKAERDRISAIMDLDESADRRDSALNIALTTDLNVEQAKSLLATIPAASEAAETPVSGDAFSEAMEKTGNPEVGASAGDHEGEQEDAAAAILKDFAAFGGVTKSK